MVSLSLLLTVGLLVALGCASVALARAGSIDISGEPHSAGASERTALGAAGFLIGASLPMVYRFTGLAQGSVPTWLTLVTGALGLIGFVFNGYVMNRIRWRRWTDAFLSAQLSEVAVVIVAAQRRSGAGSEQVDALRRALKGGRGIDALVAALQLRSVIDAAGLPEDPSWAEVRETLGHWEWLHLPQSARARAGG